jgi:hypothetical protein
LPYRQVHYLDGHVVIGEHPDERVAEYVDTRIQKVQAEDTRQLDFWTTKLHYPEAGNEQYANVLDILRADFGPQVADTPIAIISEEDYQEYDKTFNNGRMPKAGGFYSSGHITIVHQPEKNEIYGETYPLCNLLHEGGHSSMSDEEHIVSARPLTGRDTNVTESEQKAGHRIDILRAGGFQVFNPAIAPSRAIGNLWEESFAGSYTYRRKAEIGALTTFDEPSRRLDWRNQGLKYATIFTDSGPHYDRSSNALSIPWKYGVGFYQFDEKGIPKTIALNACTYGAFALDILDSKLPGLFDAMMQSRREPALKPRIEARIDSIAPGLYRDLSLYHWNKSNAERALIKVIKALRIADDHYDVRSS